MQWPAASMSPHCTPGLPLTEQLKEVGGGAGSGLGADLCTVRLARVSVRAHLVAVHQVDPLPQHDGAQQAEAAKQGGQRDGLGEGQARCVVDLRAAAYTRHAT
jgi:hypothetical protein